MEVPIALADDRHRAAAEAEADIALATADHRVRLPRG
jgi:hypothetical protein